MRRMERGERRKERGRLSPRGTMRRGRWQVRIQIDVRGAIWKEVHSIGASQWGQRHGRGQEREGWLAVGGDQWLKCCNKVELFGQALYYGSSSDRVGAGGIGFGVWAEVDWLRQESRDEISGGGSRDT